MKKRFAVIATILTVLGLAMMGAALSLAASEQASRENWRRGPGVVIDVRRDGRTFRPVVAFRDQAGQRRVFASSFATRPPLYAKGDRVWVIHDPANPGEAKIDSIITRHFISLILGAISLFFLWAGGSYFLLPSRRAGH